MAEDGGDEVHATLLRTELRTELPSPGAGPCARSSPGKASSGFATQWSTVSMSGGGATCNDDDWGTRAAIAPISPHEEVPGGCTCRKALGFLRATVVSLFVWWTAALVATSVTGAPLWDEPMVAVVMFSIGVILYMYELRNCRTLWTVVWPGSEGGSEGFATCVQTLRNAAPLVDLIAPGAAPINYKIAEWHDETRPVDPEGFAGAPKGLFLVTFPVEIFPGDPSEASALEFAQLQALRNAAGIETPRGKTAEHGPLCEEAAESVDVRSRLRWPDGSEGLPQPHVLTEGGEANCLWPFMVLSIFCLLGIAANGLVHAFLHPLEWPVRKRIFSVQGYFLGRVRFCITRAGKVFLDGDEQELKGVNRFWLKEQDWQALWSAATQAGRQTARLRRARILTCCAAGSAAFATLAAAAFAVYSKRPSLACTELGVGLMVSVLLFAGAGLIGFISHRSAQSYAEDMSKKLGGLASCATSWPEEGPIMLLIEVEQLADEKSKQASQRPIGTNKTSPTKSSREVYKSSPLPKVG